MHYHIIWTTYGTWLPGDDRGWMLKGDPAVQPPDPERMAEAHIAMMERFVILDKLQQEIAGDTIVAHCCIRKWTLLASVVKTNHVHVVVDADRDGDEVRDQLKAWCSRRLSDHAGVTTPQTKTGGRKRWFTEGAYVRRIETDEYLQEAIRYVHDQS